MQRLQRLALMVFATLVAAIVVSCEEGGSVSIVGANGQEIEVPDGTVATTATVSGTPTEPPATETPPPTPTPTATSTPQPAGQAQDVPADLPGEPYSTADFRAAVEARGATFEGLGLDPLCPNTSVPELSFLASSGNESGPVFSIWVYPNSGARSVDWATGNAVSPLTAGCTLPTASVFWNQNVVLAYRTQLEGGVDVGPGATGRNTIPVQAFLNLVP